VEPRGLGRRFGSAMLDAVEHFVIERPVEFPVVETSARLA